VYLFRLPEKRPGGSFFRIETFSEEGQ